MSECSMKPQVRDIITLSDPGTIIKVKDWGTSKLLAIYHGRNICPDTVVSDAITSADVDCMSNAVVRRICCRGDNRMDIYIILLNGENEDQ